jgi:hypothetical protein
MATLERVPFEICSVDLLSLSRADLHKGSVVDKTKKCMKLLNLSIL